MLTSIQAGRALAALAVAAFHLSLTMGVPRYGGDPVLEEWTYRGNLGVDFFFVLSGFVILMAHHGDVGNPSAAKRYLWKRFVRVYPIYLLYTLIFVALVLAGLGKNSPLPSSVGGWVSSLSLIRVSPDATPIQPAWTLFHEVGFYALFVVLILSRRVGLIVFGAWLIACLALWQYPPEDGRTPLAVYFSAYSMHFMLGAATFLVYMKFRDRLVKACGIGLAAIGILVTAYFYTVQTPHLAWAVGFAGMLLVAVVIETRFDVRAPSWLRIIGDASYSLYLLHLALQGLLLKLLISLRIAPLLGGVGTFVVVMAGTTILACLAYRFVEAPLLHALRVRITFRSDSTRMPGPKTSSIG